MNKAGVILTNKDTTKVLVVINKNSMEELKFGLPKGHREGKETIDACAARELKEETGIIIRVSPKDPKIVVSETTYYLIKANYMPAPSPQDCKEIGEARWVTWNDIYNTDCNRGLRLIRDKLQKGTQFIKRLRDLTPRSIGIVRIKPKQKQNEKKLGSHEEGSGDSTPTSKSPRCDIDEQGSQDDTNCVCNE